MNTYIAHDAHNAKNREVLHDNYGIQLPLIETRTAKVSEYITSRDKGTYDLLMKTLETTLLLVYCVQDLL